jgi:eukaryotic-like serine/threonine-protein kinase
MNAETLKPYEADPEAPSPCASSSESGPESTVRKVISQEAKPRRALPPEVTIWDVDSTVAAIPTGGIPAVDVERAGDASGTTRASDGVLRFARDFARGKILAGKYRIERKLGEGAMGVVLQATHLGLDEAVAIKLVRPEVQNIEGMLGRFAKEAKIAARIRSEHVAKVLDVGVLEPYGPYIVMEYLEGNSLAEILDARLLDGRGPLPADRVIEYVLQACEALAAAHAIDVIHRDVKPDNLFVTRHGGLETLKLLDFGISKAALAGQLLEAPTSTTSFVMGTPLYMSPEQLRSSPDIDARTDVWSMGAVMFELLSGTPPFHGSSIPEICAAILDAPPVELHAGISDPLRAIVLCCLEKDPERRFQTVAELATALVPVAPRGARAYASRASCILRASSLSSSLDLDVSHGSGSSVSAPPARSVRFQSSALVAAATVLALAALGVVSTLSSAPTPPVPPRATASSRGTPAALQLSPVSAPEAMPSTVRIAPLLASEPAATSMPQRAEPARSRAPRPQVRSRPVLIRAPSNRVDAAPSGEPPRRVRLVEQRAKLRLVGPSGGRTPSERRQ